jgi:hypothetical protein
MLPQDHLIPSPCDSHAELSKHYRLQGEIPEEVAKIFHPAVLDLLSTPEFDRRIAVQGSDNWLLFHTNESHMLSKNAVRPEI